MKEAIIVDLDGTLANCDHRVHHVQKSPKDWTSFNDEMHKDTLNLWCHKLIESMSSKGTEIILLTGRGEEKREVTESWLEKYKVTYSSLYMRSVSDERSDAVVKKEIFNKHIEKNFKTLFVVEDRKSVVEMWRENNITCLQCDWGDF